MQEDQQLMGQLRRGDRRALRRLYEKYKDGLLTMAACMLGDVSAAEDVLHDVFVSLAAQAGNASVRTNLRGYLTTSVANRARDLLRQRHSRPQELLDEATDCPIDADSPAATMVDDEEAQMLYGALTNLPDDQREVIVLHLHADMTFRAIARQQGVTTNTVQSRYRYGIEKLRTMLRAGVNK